MPYPSTRFSDFTPDMLAGYLQGFADALAGRHPGFPSGPDSVQPPLAADRPGAGSLPRNPLCAYSHGTELRQLGNAAHLAPIVVPACADVDRVFALHADNRDRIVQAYGIPAARVRVVGAGFREDVFKPAPACLQPAGRDGLTVVYAGKISAPKGVPWLIEAMRRVKGPGERRVRLLLAGGGGRRRRGHPPPGGGHGQRHLPGRLAQAELAAVLQAADVFVLPSFFEGLPLVVVESLACGCRVVMTDLPGVDGWMPAGLCAEGRVDRVPLPRLAGTDTPLPADLPEFVARLAEALEHQLAASVECRRATEPDGRLKPLSWSGVFERMQTGYRELRR